jgi:uncharacterized protein (TIGR03067 family)
LGLEENAMPFPFLTGRWGNLLLANYAVPPSLLQPYLIPGLELDLRDGQAFASLVALRMQNIHVLGIAWPGLTEFAEVNLRFYVRWGDQTGVRFVRETIPSHILTWVGRVFFNEPFTAASVTCKVQERPERLAVEYGLPYEGQTYTLAVSGDKPENPVETNEQLFFTDRLHAYDISRWGHESRYRVEHPPWPVYPVRDYRIDLDWARVYGPQWGILQGVPPASTIFAAGSEVTVYTAEWLAPTTSAPGTVGTRGAGALDGVWSVVSRTVNGQALSKDQLQLMKVVRQGDQWQLQVAGQAVSSGTVIEDPTKDPKTVDINIVQSTHPDDRGRTLPGIYQVSGSTLTLCIAAPGQARPTAFAAPAGSGYTLVVYERAKS